MLAWAAKRWSRARLLKIGIQQDNTEELLQALPISQTDKLARLEEVRHWLRSTVLESKAIADFGACVCKLHVYTQHGGNPACAAACFLLLSHASNVQVVLHAAAKSARGEHHSVPHGPAS